MNLQSRLVAYGISIISRGHEIERSKKSIDKKIRVLIYPNKTIWYNLTIRFREQIEPNSERGPFFFFLQKSNEMNRDLPETESIQF